SPCRQLVRWRGQRFSFRGLGDKMANLCVRYNPPRRSGGIMRKLGLVVLLVCALSSAAQNLSPEVKEFVKVDTPVIALEHVRVIDGTGAGAREDQTVVLAKGKIESISSAAEASVPQDGKVLDLH